MSPELNNIKSIAAFWLGMFCVLLAAGCAAKNPYLEIGERKLAEGDDAAAIEQFSEAIQLDQRSLPAYFGRGKAYENQHAFGFAIADFELVLLLDPKHLPAKERLVAAWLETGEGYKAREQLKEIEKKMPPRQYLFARGRAELQCGEAKAAKEYLDRLLAADPQHSQGAYYRGVANSNLGELELAEADFSKNIELSPKNAASYWRRALVRERLNQKNLAEADRKIAGELDPTHRFAETEIGKNMIEMLKGIGANDTTLQPVSNKSRE